MMDGCCFLLKKILTVLLPFLAFAFLQKHNKFACIQIFNKKISSNNFQSCTTFKKTKTYMGSLFSNIKKKNQ